MGFYTYGENDPASKGDFLGYAWIFIQGTTRYWQPGDEALFLQRQESAKGLYNALRQILEVARPYAKKIELNGRDVSIEEALQEIEKLKPEEGARRILSGDPEQALNALLGILANASRDDLIYIVTHGMKVHPRRQNGTPDFSEVLHRKIAIGDAYMPVADVMSRINQAHPEPTKDFAGSRIVLSCCFMTGSEMESLRQRVNAEVIFYYEAGQGNPYRYIWNPSSEEDLVLPKPENGYRLKIRFRPVGTYLRVPADFRE